MRGRTARLSQEPQGQSLCAEGAILGRIGGWRNGWIGGQREKVRGGV